MIIVCPLSRLQETVGKSGAQRVITLVRSEELISHERESLRGNCIELDRHLWLEVDDITEALEGMIAPNEEHVEELTASLEGWNRSTPLIVHCYAGISRSTATAFVLACALLPNLAETEIAKRLRLASPATRPNTRIVAHADSYLKRGGRMVRAVGVRVLLHRHLLRYVQAIRDTVLGQHIIFGRVAFAAAALGLAAASGLHAQESCAAAIPVIKEFTDASLARSTGQREIVPPFLPVLSRANRVHSPLARGRGAPPEFIWPVRGIVVLHMGDNSSHGHADGINIAVAQGTIVRAAADGVVVYSGKELRGYGCLVLIDHGHGWITAYVCNCRSPVKRGNQVRQGQSIATMERSGAMSFLQLHFEIGRWGKPLNTRNYLPKL
jgi:predicted protein tyrosine phosphatase